eukprot:1133623-Rhodomonas_salina.1
MASLCSASSTHSSLPTRRATAPLACHRTPPRSFASASRCSKARPCGGRRGHLSVGEVFRAEHGVEG